MEKIRPIVFETLPKFGVNLVYKSGLRFMLQAGTESLTQTHFGISV